MPNANQMITVSAEKCTGCSACVRVCPSPEAIIIKMSDSGRLTAEVDGERCIGCGECIRGCPHGAADYADDTEEFMRFIERNTAAVIIDPVIKTALPSRWRGVLDYLRQKGVRIYDVSLGTDICTWAHLRAAEEGMVNSMITQICPAAVNYLEMYQPKLIQELSPVHSPTACQAMYLQRYMQVNVPFAVLSSCIAKKSECDETGLIQYNVTLKKLKEYFAKHKIAIPENNSDDEYKFDSPDLQVQTGAVYPHTLSLRDDLLLHAPELNITSSEGVRKVCSELDMYSRLPEEKHPKIFDVLTCEYGCCACAAADPDISVFEIMAAAHDAEKAARKNRKASLFGKGEDKQFKKFDEILTLKHFLRTYAQRKPAPPPSSDQLGAAFRSIGKLTENDRHIDCRACGYNTCYEMAAAIHRGRNVPKNCIVFAGSNKNSGFDDLSEDHDKLLSVADKCKGFLNEILRKAYLISDNINKLISSDEKTAEKLNTVGGILDNLINFCLTYEGSDGQTIDQLTAILSSISAAFKGMEESAKQTAPFSAAVSKAAVEITGLLDEINETIDEAAYVDDKY